MVQHRDGKATQMEGLAIFFGAIVGFALGLTGGGGGIFAVPLLVFGLAVAPREAVGISLAAVGGTALFGVVPRLMHREVELRTGLLFAIAGMIGAPLGSYLSGMVPENWLLVLFGILMVVVAQRMWVKSSAPKSSAPKSRAPKSAGDCSTPALEGQGNTCQRDADGKLLLTSPCARLLVLVGLATGVLSGMFGVGGGFVIVPALVLFSGMSMHLAVGTSLFVIVLVSISGVASHFASGNPLSISTTLLFLIGGVAGMWLGGRLGKQLKATTLQKVFSIAMVLVAGFVIVKSL